MIATGELVSLLDDLIRDNNLTCEPHPDNERCMCSTARALRVTAGERSPMTDPALLQFAAEQIRKAADDCLADPFERRALYEYADELLDPCQCPDEHCGDCGCCPDEWGPR